MKKNRFYKEDSGKWYIDLPEWIEKGLPKEDLEMVMGADTMLDMLSNNSDEVTLRFSDKIGEDNYMHKVELAKFEEDEYGATYKVISFHDPIDVWLCPVTKFVFDGNFPDKIYIY